jgi:glycosyltransferase involved in cell wall biosynthesis
MHYFDITNLIEHLKTNIHVTGIQRIQMESVMASYFDEELRLNMSCCYFGKDRKWHQVNLNDFLDIMINLESESVENQNKLFLDISNQYDQKQHVNWEKGDVLFLIGATWGMTGFFESLNELKSKKVVCITYLHDILPITHPEFFELNHDLKVSYWLSNTLVTSDAIICNSKVTLNSLQENTDYKGLTEVVDLSIRPKFNLLNSRHPNIDQTVLNRYKLTDKHYILSVGTLEPRKNHSTLIHAWLKFQKESSELCPYLVIVGKCGWLFDPIKTLIQSSNRSNKIIWLENIHDGELAVLYRHCLFTAFLSRAEGWGLPITESLSFDKICLLGENSGAAEAAQGLAYTVDQESERSVYQAIKKLSTEKQFVLEMENKIKSTKSFKSWVDFLKEIRSVAKKIRGQLKHSVPIAQVRQVYTFGRNRIAPLKGDLSIGEHMRRGPSWNIPINSGNAVSGLSSKLFFNVEKTTHYFGHFFVQCASGRQLKLFKNDKPVWTGSSNGLKFIVADLGLIDKDRGVHLELLTDEMFPFAYHSSSKTKFLIGCFWIELQIFEMNDMKGRVKSLEHFVEVT